ncbi:MAG: GTPase domain-containing protein [Rubrivivax sp.]
MTTITLSLVSHTNVGKTTLARTLLGRDIGEVRDAPHVTEFADEHLLVQSTGGHRLVLWDTPGFGDSVRLARRMRQLGGFEPLGWLLGQVWDRWRDRAFWLSQQALRHVREGSDVLLYLVNASEPDAGYLQSEMQLLGWTGRPVLVLLNQLGVPRETALEQAEVERWREQLAPWTHVRAVLPLDARALLGARARAARCGARRAGGRAVPTVATTAAVAATTIATAAAAALLRWTNCAPRGGRARSDLRAFVRRDRRQWRARRWRARTWQASTFSGRLREWGARLVQADAADPAATAAEERLAAARWPRKSARARAHCSTCTASAAALDPHRGRCRRAPRRATAAPTIRSRASSPARRRADRVAPPRARRPCRGARQARSPAHWQA